MTATLLIGAGLLGLVVGSLLNVVVHRLPVMLDGGGAAARRFNLATPRSHCPNCLATLRWRDNIPVLSWLALRGRCAHCRAPIAARYLVIEVLAGVAGALTAWRIGASPQLPAALALAWILLALAAIDWETHLLPDQLTLPLLWLGLCVNCFDGFAPARDAVLGAAAGYGLLWLCAQSFRLASGRDGMGHGDMKLCAALGGWLGWQLVPALIAAFSVLGLALGLLMLRRSGGDRHVPVPVGPCIALAGWLAVLERDAWLAWMTAEWSLLDGVRAAWPWA